MRILLLLVQVYAENVFYGELINQNLFDTHRTVRVGNVERQVKYDPNVAPIVQALQLKLEIQNTMIVKPIHRFWRLWDNYE